MDQLGGLVQVLTQLNMLGRNPGSMFDTQTAQERGGQQAYQLLSDLDWRQQQAAAQAQRYKLEQTAAEGEQARKTVETQRDPIASALYQILREGGPRQVLDEKERQLRLSTANPENLILDALVGLYGPKAAIQNYQEYKNKLPIEQLKSQERMYEVGTKAQSERDKALYGLQGRVGAAEAEAKGRENAAAYNSNADVVQQMLISQLINPDNPQSMDLLRLLLRSIQPRRLDLMKSGQSPRPQ